MRRLHIPDDWDPNKPLFLHLMAHYAGQEAAFQDDADHEAFKRILAHSSRETGLEICAYCPNYNHHHLLGFGTPGQAGRLMHRLQTGLAVYHRKKYGGRGHVFTRPYLGYAKLSPVSILDCSMYINGNPFKDGATRSLFEFRHSSLPFYVGERPPPDFVNVKRVLRLLPKGSASPQEAYRRGILAWAARCPTRVGRVAEILADSRLGKRRLRDPERVGALVSQAAALLEAAPRRTAGKGIEPWVSAATFLLREEGLSVRQVAPLVQRNYVTVHRRLKGSAEGS
jgi:hypothetical protein